MACKSIWNIMDIINIKIKQKLKSLEKIKSEIRLVPKTRMGFAGFWKKPVWFLSFSQAKEERSSQLWDQCLKDKKYTSWLEAIWFVLRSERNFCLKQVPSHLDAITKKKKEKLFLSSKLLFQKKLYTNPCYLKK